MINASQAHCHNSKLREYLSGWQRARAEVMNLQSRMSQEEERHREKVTKEVTHELLALSDNFQAMVKHVPEELSGHPWTQGVLHIARQMEGILEDFNIKTIEAEGQQFDPNLHEAIEQTSETKLATGTVIEVLQPGYLMGSEVIRPAKVKVAK